MHTSADKSAHVGKASQTAEQGPFFRKASEAGFFAGASFFPVQPKLEVSQPDDPQEVEAEAVAAEVVANSEPTMAAPPAGDPGSDNDSEHLQRMEEDNRESSEGEIEVQRRTTHAITRNPDRSPLQRQEGAGGFASRNLVEETLGDEPIQAFSLSRDLRPLIARRARGPPAEQESTTDSAFENSLAASKAQGAPLPGPVLRSMESGFGADFSGVRIHTDSTAQALSTHVHAQAFTHGNHIYFNTNRYAPETATGKHLLAHELTHTIQQGAAPLQARSSSAQSISRKTLSRRIQRSSDESQRSAAVELAKAEVGQVSANEEGPDGYRVGWERLVEYFKTTFGEDRVLAPGAAFQKDTVSESHIKKKSLFKGNVIAPDGRTVLHNQERDAMPSWCGIFAFWALNKGGIPLKKWTLGRSMFPPGAAYPSGHVPQPGDIAWRREFSHFALVESSDGSSVTSINGNTAGDDNLGGEVQVQTHPIAHWYAFFDPASIQEGPLQTPGAGTGSAAPPVRSLEELRKSLFGVDRKAEEQNQLGTEASKAAGVEPSAKVESKEEIQREVEEEREEQEAAHIESAPLMRAADSERWEQAHGRLGFDHAAQPLQADNNVQAQLLPVGDATSGRSRQVMRRQEGPWIRGPPPRAPPSIEVLHRQRIQRGWLGDAWNAVTGIAGEAAAWIDRGLDRAKAWLLQKVRDFVARIPGYSILSLVLGKDPITGVAAPLTGVNLLNAGLDVLPLGHMFRALLRRLGIFNDVAEWLEGRVEDLSSLASGIVSRFSRFWDDLSLDDAADPQSVMDRVANLLRSTIQGIVGFVERSATTFLDRIKEVMIREIAAFVRNQIPSVYPLLKVALGFDPETLQPVARNGTNILSAFLNVSEDGREQRRQMLETGTFQKIAGWIDRGISVFSRAWTLLKAAIDGIWDHVTVENLFSPVATLTRIWNQFSEPVRIVGQFMLDAAREILRVIKDALMARLSAYARETRGYTLVTVIIGRDPFTGRRVRRTVHNVVRGFMGLMDGGEQQYQQLKESGAIDRIIGKVNAAVARLNMTPQSIIQLFINLWNSFSINDLARPIQAFQRIVNTFAEPILRLIRFVVEILMIVVEAILILMNFPFDLIGNIVANARRSWALIKRNVPEFFKNLLRAIKQGFTQFFDNIGTHLINGVVGWLMSELADAGVPTLSDFSLQGVITWTMEVLGISVEKLWEKLAEHPRIGPQRVAQIRSMIDRLVGVWTFIQDVRERGMAAIWDKIKEQLSNLWSTVLDAVKNWIMERIITAVVTKLLSMLDPTGIMAVVNSAIALYRAVQSFIRYITEMLQVVNSFVEGIAEIASGGIASAANFLEGALGRAMPIVIGFLANQVGLGGIGRRIGEIIGTVRGKVDEAIGWLVNRAVDTAFAALDRIISIGRGAVAAVRNWWRGDAQFTANDGSRHRILFTGEGENAVLSINPEPRGPYETFLTEYESRLPPDATTERAAATQARGIATQIDEAKRRRVQGANDAETQANEEAKATAIAGLIEQLAQASRPLFGSEKPADNEIELLPTSNSHAYAESMSISKYWNTSKVTSHGSGPDRGFRHNLFEPLRARMEGNRSYYIRGHLLNDNLGGPGKWSNMTALSQTGNRNHLNQVESRVKAAFDAGAVIQYQVTASGSQSVTIPQPSDKPSFTRVNDVERSFPAIQALIEAEQNVITTLNCSAHTMKKEGNAWVQDRLIVDQAVNNPVSTDYGSYDIGDRPPPGPVNVNTAAVDALSELSSIGPVRAQAIVNYRANAQNPAFVTKNDLTRVNGIGPETVASIIDTSIAF